LFEVHISKPVDRSIVIPNFAIISQRVHSNASGIIRYDGEAAIAEK